MLGVIIASAADACTRQLIVRRSTDDYYSERHFSHRVNGTTVEEHQCMKTGSKIYGALLVIRGALEFQELYGLVFAHLC